MGQQKHLAYFCIHYTSAPEHGSSTLLFLPSIIHGSYTGGRHSNLDDPMPMSQEIVRDVFTVPHFITSGVWVRGGGVKLQSNF